MNIGYARVSTRSQNLQPQIDQLKKYGCETIIEEKVSTGKKRPALETVLNKLQKNDTLAVTRMDRLARSMKDLIRIMDIIEKARANIVFLDQAIDTSTPSGKLTYFVFAAVAEFERDLIRERTRAGLRAAMAQGRKGGRKQKFTDNQIRAMLVMYDEKTPVPQILDTFKVSKPTLYRYLDMRKQGLLRHLETKPEYS